jgi:hypothetical protein
LPAHAAGEDRRPSEDGRFDIVKREKHETLLRAVPSGGSFASVVRPFAERGDPFPGEAAATLREDASSSSERSER